MSPLRILLVLAAVVLLGAGVVLGYISVLALRRNEGVFLPAGYVAAACLVGGTLLVRAGVRG